MQSQAWLPHNIVWMICIAPMQCKINPINKFSQIMKGKTSSPLPRPQSWHPGKHYSAAQASSRTLPYILLLGNTFSPLWFPRRDFSQASCPFYSLHQLRKWGELLDLEKLTVLLTDFYQFSSLRELQTYLGQPFDHSSRGPVPWEGGGLSWARVAS